MSAIKLVVSDLHLADGTSILDCFGSRQQAAFEGLLAATSPLSASPLSQSEDIELIINGDCFDFLVTTPYSSSKTTDVTTALQKIDRIIAAHLPFFTALRTFISHPGRHITFITGNHDLELCFAEVRTHIRNAITGNVVSDEDEQIYFCPSRFYRPLPDIHIEHGNNYDFWNHTTQGIWDEQGQPLDRNPTTLTLSVGSRYFQSATHAISTQYAYFDHFDPPINNTHQIAFLCLLDAELLIKVANDTMQVLSYPHQPLANLSLLDRRNPIRLFEEVIQDFAAFQTDMVAQKQDWTSATKQDASISQADIVQFITAREALTLSPVQSVAALLAPSLYQMSEDVALGMCGVLESDPTLRYAIAGHTHQTRFDSTPDSTITRQVYFNTGSWTTHLALPAPEDVTPALVEWLRAPDWNAVPLRDNTQFVFVLVTSSDDQPTTASLCAWEDDTNRSYRILA